MKEVVKAAEGEIYDIELAVDLLKENEKIAEREQSAFEKERREGY